jgi:hypothetical protein
MRRGVEGGGGGRYDIIIYFLRELSIVYHQDFAITHTDNGESLHGL